VLIFLSLTEAAAELSRRLNRDGHIGVNIGLVSCLALFAVSNDLNLQQITGVATPDVRLRMGVFEQYEALWYWRWDYESPAVFINERSGFRKDDRLIVVEQPPVSFYLRVPHASYYPRTSDLFWDHSRKRGTVDIWSNQPLLSTPDDLQDYSRCARTVWLVRAVSPQRRPFEIEAIWGEHLVRAAEVFRSRDSRLAVVRIELLPESGC
jgi:hypothetical protein